MGNVLIDLDQRFAKFQFSYIDAYRKREFEIAASLLFQANCNLPLEARVTNMVLFKKKNRSLGCEQNYEHDAKTYCDYWSQFVFTSIAEYTSAMLENIQD